VILLKPVDAECDGHVELWTLFKNASHVGHDPLLDTTVRHQIDRFEFVVLIEGTDNFRQILACKRLSTCDDQDWQPATQCLADTRQLGSRHLLLLACRIVQLLGEEAVAAPHVADRSDQDVENHRRGDSTGENRAVALDEFQIIIHIGSLL